MRPIFALAWVEMLHVVRDRATLAQALMIPVIQLLILSNAATFTLRDTPLFVVDQDRTSTSRHLISRFEASRHFRIVGYSGSPVEAEPAMLSRSAAAILVVPAHFERDLVLHAEAPVQLVLDAEKGLAAGIVQSYGESIFSRFAADATVQVRPTVRGISRAEATPPVSNVPRLEVRRRNWYNPTLDYKHYMVPGIVVSLVTIIGTLLTAQNIAREKELGTLEQLNVTPIARWQFITAKLLPFWILGIVEFGMGISIARFVFHVPIVGSLPLLFAAAGLYLVAPLSIGLLISTMVDTQQQAMFVTFFAMMLYLLMSGLYTPIDSMPRWVQILAEVNPVRHFVQVSREILLKGADIAAIARPLTALALFAGGTLTLAVRRYSKRIA